MITLPLNIEYFAIHETLLTMSVCDSETALLQANPTARSELDVLKQRITELEAELEKKNVEIFDLNNENQKLRKELKS